MFRASRYIGHRFSSAGATSGNELLLRPKETEKLYQSIEAGRLSLYFVLSLARSRSTAMQLSLAQSPGIDGQINLPVGSGYRLFAKPQDRNYKFHDFRDTLIGAPADIAAEKINNVAEKALLKKAQARFIVNEQCVYLTESHLEFISSISNNVIFNVRDPRVQFLSYLLRATNDLFLKKDIKGNTHCFDVEDILALCYSNTEELNAKLAEIVEAKKIELKTGDPWYKRTSGHESTSTLTSLKDLFLKLIDFEGKHLEVAWSNVYNSWRVLSGKANVNCVMSDGETFMAAPIETLRGITTKVTGLEFTEGMVSNWTPSRNFVCKIDPPEDNDNAWNGLARESGKVTKDNDSTKGLFLQSEKVKDPQLAGRLSKATSLYQELSTNIVARHANLS